MANFASLLDGTFSSGFMQAMFIFVALIGVVGMAINLPRRFTADPQAFQNRKIRFRLCTAIVAFLVIFAFGVLAIVISAANKEIDSKLASGISSATLNGNPIEKAKVLAALIALRCDGGQHSHPVTRHDLHIETGQGPLHLQLAQDSNTPTTYWIYYPKFGLTSLKEVRKACKIDLT